MILAIDPGTTESAWVVLGDDLVPVSCAKEPNGELISRLESGQFGSKGQVVIEMIASYGRPVGQETFETCVWIGRFIQASKIEPRLIYRKEVVKHISPGGNDASIRQALIDRYGPGRREAVGLKASPGPLYHVKADMWQALALGITAAETPRSVTN